MSLTHSLHSYIKRFHKKIRAIFEQYTTLPVDWKIVFKGVTQNTIVPLSKDGCCFVNGFHDSGRKVGEIL